MANKSKANRTDTIEAELILYPPEVMLNGPLKPAPNNIYNEKKRYFSFDRIRENAFLR